MNKKIRNATPTQIGSVQYRSKLEARFAELLNEYNIPFEYESQRWELLPKTRYNGELIRPVFYTPDFIIDNHAVEIKGFKNDVYPLKKKLIIKYLQDTNSSVIFHEIQKVSQMKELIDIILKEK